jgi:DMSO/TMAO reductase YedYZ molybdopterin-dependent catalytic subunit
MEMPRTTEGPKIDSREDLPLHKRERLPRPAALRIDGLVERALTLRVADLRALSHVTMMDDFTCLEGWSVPGLRWQGTPLAGVLDLAHVRPAAQWVQASAGEGRETFSLPLPLAEARTALLAYGLNGGRLAPEHGGPLRLVVPGQACFTSIKWLDHLEVRAESGANSARAIATARLRRPVAATVPSQTTKHITDENSDTE